jgi:hypothetical protein
VGGEFFFGRGGLADVIRAGAIDRDDVAFAAVGSLMSTFTWSFEILVVTMKKIRSRNVMSIIGASWNPISSSCFLAIFMNPND